MQRLARLAAITFILTTASFAAAPADGVPHAGDSAPAFTSPRASGGNVSLSDFRGKPVYLNFFATWCGPCNDEAPSVGKLYQKYRARGLNVVGLNEYEDKGKALGFAQKYNWKFVIAVDDGGVANLYGAIALPVHVFIDKQGKVSTFRLGQMDPSDIDAAIKKIL